MKQTRKRILSILAAAVMVFCTLLGGILPQAVSAAADTTVYITAGSVSGTPGSRVPVTVDIRSESAIKLMSLSLLYDSAMPPVPADPAEPNVPKAEVDLRSSAYAEPTDELLDLTVKPNKSYLHIASNTAFRWGRITVWFDIPEDAAVGTKYPLDLQADVLLGGWLTTKLSGALTGGTITVTDQPAETTPPPAQVEAAFDITEETLLLEVNTSGETFEIAYTASKNLDYIEWRSDNVRIGVDESGYLYNFNFPDDATYVIGAVTATAHFLDGTVLTDTVSVYARDRRNLIEIPDIIG
ncbi:MAG: hypothetical protein J5753_00205, partial [Oscillospiraceae bacterium]|nr:hypothetical protein [Oscillospiraceae bacterium]